MNLFKRISILFRQLPFLTSAYLKIMGIALILSATLFASLSAVRHFVGTPQTEPATESTRTAITEKSVKDNPAVSRAKSSKELDVSGSESNAQSELSSTEPNSQQPAPAAQSIVKSTVPVMTNNPVDTRANTSAKPPVKAVSEMPSDSGTIASRKSKTPFTAITDNPAIGGAGVSDNLLLSAVKKTTAPAAGIIEELTPLIAMDNGKQGFSFGGNQKTQAQQGTDTRPTTFTKITGKPVDAKPKELKLAKSGKPFNGDLRSLPNKPQSEKTKFQHERVLPNPQPYNANNQETAISEQEPQSSITPGANAPAPAPITTFDGLGRAGGWGNGYPPDTVGDVGPNHYIQAINTAMAVYDKNTGAILAGPFSFNTLMSQGNFGNLCDTDNFGDPVVLYDTFEDRWIVTDFAFKLNAGAIVNPPGAFQCFAVSKTGDPVTGGWNFYSIQQTDGLHDYEKLSVWSDGIYMSANMFGFAANGSFQGVRTWAFNKAQMYAGSPTVQVVSFDVGTGDFTLLPSNARLQTGTPPAGTPNHFVSTWTYLNVVQVYKLKVDWNKISLSTFTGPFDQATGESWPNALVANAPQSGTATLLDTLNIRAMMQNQYTNINGVESLWATHTVRRANTTGAAAPRWYQLNITGGTVAANTLQRSTWDPDVNNTTHRFMPSLAVDRMGNMAIGYTASGSAIFPSLRYAGRLATDPVNTFSQTEQTLFEGTGSQTNTTRWGDYSAMSLDPDGCTFWYTNEYYSASGSNYRTRIGSFKFGPCVPVGNGGTVSGQVTVSPGGTPLSGATVALGSRITTTDASGNYSFTGIPAGTYPIEKASSPGYTSSTTTDIVVVDGSTTTKNFALADATDSDCLIDTTQSDFQNGVLTTVDLNTSPGDVVLPTIAGVDQQNTTVGTSGVGINITTWGGQSFTPAVTGQLTKADINLFCSGCGTGPTPNLTLSLRATSGGLPTGSDLASATLTGFISGASSYYTATFASPPTLTAGTQYALLIRPTANPTAGTYALTRSGTSTAGADVYAGGARLLGATSGTVWSIPLTGTATTDTGFKTYMQAGFATSGNLVSSAKDANPAVGQTPTWGTLSWTGVTPAGTNIRLQVGASNSATGIFNFVGPDGTANTFFTSGASLSQFNGFRFLKYKALLTGTSTATPTLNDVTICFANGTQTATSLTADATTGIFGGTINLSATLTDGVNPISGQTVAFTLNGVNKGSASTNASGVATISNISLAGVNVGSYPTGIGASFGGSGFLTSSTDTAALTVNKAPQVITFGTLSNKTFGDAPFTVGATGGASGNPVTFAATGNCTISGGTVTITGAGSCTVTASQAGNANYNAAVDIPQSFNIAKATATISLSNLSKTYTGSPLSATATTTPAGLSGISLTYDGSATAPTNAGSYAVVASLSDSNYQAADAAGTFVISKAAPVVTATGNTCAYSGSACAGSGTATGVGGNDLGAVTLNYTPGGSTAPINAGSYTVVASIGATANHTAGSSAPASITVNQANQTITFGALPNKNFGDAPFTVSATGGASGNPVTFAAAGNCTSGGTNGSTITITGTGSCTVTASQAGNSNYNAATPVPQSFTISEPICNTVSLPTNITVATNTEFIVPMAVNNTTGRNITAYDFTLTYNPAVVTPIGVETPGTLSNNWSITTNNSSGTLVISGFNTGALSGAGTLLNIRFISTGAIGTTSNLNLTSFTFNEGVPCVTAVNGNVTIISGAISGKVTYANAASSTPVPGVTVNAAGSIPVNGTTNGSGDYSLSGFGIGAYTVTPSKTGQVNGISNFDASAVAQQVVGYVTLNAAQQTAADVSGNGTISSLDASYIAQYIAGFSNPSSTGTWKFTPANRPYPNVQITSINQDYSAILMGEVTGNWNPAQAFAGSTQSDDKAESVTTENGQTDNVAQPEQVVTVSAPLPRTTSPGVDFAVDLSATNTTGENIFGYEFNLLYDASVIVPQAGSPCDGTGTISAGRSIVCNPNTPGLLRVVVFSTNGTPLSGAGTLLKVNFTAIGAAGSSSPLTFQNFMFNEGTPQDVTTDGAVQILGPTAASASISGRVVSPTGRGIARARVSITGTDGSVRATTSNQFGGFSFSDLAVGETYVINVSSKSYRFKAQTVSVVDNVRDIMLIADQ